MSRGGSREVEKLSISDLSYSPYLTIIDNLNALLTSLFSAGEQGAIYIPKPVVNGVQSLFQDSAGTVPVTADGDPVGKMLDQSGNNNHATQSVSGSRPVYRTDGVLHWLEFGGVNSYIDVDITASQPISLTLSALFANTGTTVVYSTTDSTGSVRFDLLTVNDASPDYRIYSGDPVVANGFSTPGEEATLSNLHNSGSSYIRKDGSLVSSGNSGTMGLSGFRLGSSFNTSSYFNGRVYGIYLRQAIPSESELTKIESYFSSLRGATL